MNRDDGAAAGNTAILVDISFGKNDKESLNELKELARSDQLSVAAIVEGCESSRILPLLLEKAR